MKFPKVTGRSLNGMNVTLPDSAAGKIALIIMAFVRQPAGVVDSWLAPFENEFGADPYTFYEIPMLKGIWAKTISGIIDEGMRKGIPEKMHNNVVSYYGNTEAYCSLLEINDKSLCYTFLLDKYGTIRWRGQGTASTGDVQEMLRIARELKK
jgi:hypothetical protein